MGARSFRPRRKGAVSRSVQLPRPLPLLPLLPLPPLPLLPLLLVPLALLPVLLLPLVLALLLQSQVGRAGLEGAQDGATGWVGQQAPSPAAVSWSLNPTRSTMHPHTRAHLRPSGNALPSPPRTRRIVESSGLGT